MKRLTLLLILLCISSIQASQSNVAHRLGLCGGLAQMVAFDYQVSFKNNLSVEVYAMPLFFINTAGCRVIWGDISEGFHPRLFGGIAVFDMRLAESPEEPYGVESYLWTGAGLGYSFKHFRVFTDIGYIAEGAKDRGLGYSTGAALSGGFLFDL